MKFQEEQGRPECYKIMLVSLKPDGCRVLKGPMEEIRLAEILRDDYHSSRYEKMLQLVVREMVEESEQKVVLQQLSLEHLREALGNRTEKLECSYQRKIDGIMQPVTAEIFARRFGEQGELEEFMVYVYQRDEKLGIEGCVWRSKGAGAGENRKL